uniref:Late embryogenesis abundant protein LEA-2 subgroup domain-containing protein n=1 Tax=Leersia perrieri TaxID=77586 RepID=A0A0D9VR97_9ORYZ
MGGTTMNGADEQELPLFHPSPCAYYVQSPSAASHTLSHPASESTAIILSPFPDAAFAAPRHSHLDAATVNDHDHDQEASRLTLSRYSSSRGSNNSFLAADNKKLPSSHCGRQALRVLSGRSGGEGDDDDDGEGGRRRSGAWRYVKLDPDAPCCCIVFHVAWRVAVSVAFALLVFFVATKPRDPTVTFKIGKIQQFSLGEGLDVSGVITSFLSCNLSVVMAVDNHSKVFALHVRPPLLDMSFGRFTFATSSSQGGEKASYVDVAARGKRSVRLFVAAEGKPMYAAGRGMQDLLESGDGLPLAVTVRAGSRYRMVGSLVRLSYRHDTRCVVRLRRTPRQRNAIDASRYTCSPAR